LRANFKLVFFKNTKKKYKMKTIKIILLSTAALALLTVIGVNIHLNKIVSSKDSDVTLKNIEALSGEFDFNGQSWDDDHHWYNILGQKWTPTVETCVVINEAVPIYVDGVLVGYGLGKTGSKVECSEGDGNCWNGTSCILGN
jgi:hypothetical protein